MLKYLYIVLLCFISFNIPVNSQAPDKKKGKFLFSLGMGIEYSSTPSYTEYLRNELALSSRDSIKTFSTGIEFFGSFEYGFTNTISGKIDYSYYLRSNNYTISYYVFDYTIKSHQPYAMVFYNSINKNFSFKIGAGAGYHFQVLENNISSINTLTYTSSGPALKGEVIFAPKFSPMLETYISGFFFGTTTTPLKDGNGNVLKSTTGEEVKLGSFGVGARLGLSFYLN